MSVPLPMVVVPGVAARGGVKVLGSFAGLSVTKLSWKWQPCRQGSLGSHPLTSDRPPLPLALNYVPTPSSQAATLPSTSSTTQLHSSRLFFFDDTLQWPAHALRVEHFATCFPIANPPEAACRVIRTCPQPNLAATEQGACVITPILRQQRVSATATNDSIRTEISR